MANICKYCGNNFSSKSNLKRHLKTCKMKPKEEPKPEEILNQTPEEFEQILTGETTDNQENNQLSATTKPNIIEDLNPKEEKTELEIYIEQNKEQLTNMLNTYKKVGTIAQVHRPYAEKIYKLITNKELKWTNCKYKNIHLLQVVMSNINKLI